MPATVSVATAAYATHPHAMGAPFGEPLAGPRSNWPMTGDSWAVRGTLAAPLPAYTDTRQRLLRTRVEKLLPVIWADWQRKQEHLQGINAEDATLRCLILLYSLPLAATAISTGFTYEQSIYVRATLPGEIGGILYAEVSLGPDADPTDDTLITIRENKQEKWFATGSFDQAVIKLRSHLATC